VITPADDRRAIHCALHDPTADNLTVPGEHLGTPRPAVETLPPAADHHRIANDVIELFAVSEQIELFRRMLLRWSETEIDTAIDALSARYDELPRQDKLP
jgi:hypothetical protein